MHERLTAWLGAAIVAGLAVAAHAGCNLGVMATLPVTMQGLRPTTVAQINGVDVPFLIDSGAFYSVITPGSARQFGLRLTSAPFGFTMRGVGGSAAVSVATVKAFGIAGQSLPNIEFIVGGSEVGQDSGGVIGDNILSIGDAEYDLGHGTVRLIRPHDCPRTAFPFWAHGPAFSEVDIEPGVGRRATKVATTVFINGVKVRAFLDTGAAGSVISHAAATRAGIDVAGPGSVTAGVATGFGRHAVQQWTVPVAVFKIGDEEVRKTFLRVIEAIGDGPDAPDMLLGADFFLSHHVYVARSLHKLYFTYNGGNVFNLKAVEAVPATADAAGGPPATAAASADEPTTAEALARRGAAFAARHEYGRAIADLTRAVTLAPQEPRYLAERAQAYAGNRQPYLAMADLDAVLRLRPADVPALLQRAEARLAGRDRAGALADVAAAAAAAPHEADVRFTLGVLYDRLDDRPAAIGQYDLWLAAHPDDVKAAVAYNNRCWARALLGTGLDLAEKDCSAAHRLTPANVRFLDSRGLVRLRRGDFVHAIADYDAVLAKEPKVAWSLYGRGIARLQTGATAEGTADLAAARTIAPNLATFAHAHGIDPPGSGAPPPAAGGPSPSSDGQATGVDPPPAR